MSVDKDLPEHRTKKLMTIEMNKIIEKLHIINTFDFEDILTPFQYFGYYIFTTKK